METDRIRSHNSAGGGRQTELGHTTVLVEGDRNRSHNSAGGGRQTEVGHTSADGRRW